MGDALPAPERCPELLVTEARLGARRAYEIGFVNRLTDPGRALDVALELAEEICLSSPTAVRSTLLAIEEQWADAEKAGWAATARAQEVQQSCP